MQWGKQPVLDPQAVTRSTLHRVVPRYALVSQQVFDFWRVDLFTSYYVQ